MRILLLHNQYVQAGGEDRVVETERALLMKHGHAVELLAVDNSAISGLRAKAKAAVGAVYSVSARRLVRDEIRAFRPDVVHLHNSFPLLSPSVLDACAQAHIPVVHTLHNYRLVCPGAYLMRASRPCEVCLGKSTYHAVPRRCYQDSTLTTLAAVMVIQTHRRLRTWERKVDRFVALTNFSRGIFIRAGLPREKISVKPNGVPSHVATVSSESDAQPRRKEALFVGRLSPEKGVEALLQAWRLAQWRLRVIGAGPLSDQVAREAGNSGGRLVYEGHLQHEDVQQAMRRAAVLVMPSQCYEGFPLSIVEAFANGTPVVTSRLGSMAEIVEDGRTGVHFRSGDARDLADRVTWLLDSPTVRTRMGQLARKTYDAHYTAEADYERIMAIYDDAIKAASQRYAADV